MKTPTEKYNVVEVIDSDGKVTHYVFYACGHCSAQRQVASVRDTPQYRCTGCARYLCESVLCNSRCTPLYAMAKDKFESVGQWGILVPALMAGATTPEQAILLGFPKETFNG